MERGSQQHYGVVPGSWELRRVVRSTPKKASTGRGAEVDAQTADRVLGGNKYCCKHSHTYGTHTIPLGGYALATKTRVEAGGSANSPQRIKARGVIVEQQQQYNVIKKRKSTWRRATFCLTSEDWDAFNLAWELTRSGAFSEDVASHICWRHLGFNAPEY